MSRIPRYRRHSTRDLAFVEHAGKRTYFPGRYDSQESRSAWHEFLRGNGFLVQQSPAGDVQQVLLPVLAERFMRWVDQTYPRGRKSYATNLRCAVKLLAEFAGIEPAVKFTPLRMKAFQQWLIGRGLTRRYINDTTSRVRLIFKWGASEELLPVAAYQALLTVPGLRRGRGAKEKPPRKPVAWEHVKATLSKLRPTVRAMVEFHWLTGARSQSICAARAGQFDCSAKIWQWHPKHKTEHLGHVLTIFIGPKAQKVIAPLLKGKRAEDYVFRPANKSGKRSRRYRSFYDSDTYRRAVGRAAAKAGVPHWFPHQIRHARGTQIRETHGLEAAQAALGHAKINSTELYTARQMELAKRVAAAMG